MGSLLWIIYGPHQSNQDSMKDSFVVSLCKCVFHFNLFTVFLLVVALVVCYHRI